MMNLPKESQKERLSKLLPARIKQIREDNQLSQEDFGKEIDVSRAAVSYWESGKTTPSSKNLRAIAARFNVPMEALTSTYEPPAGMVAFLTGFSEALQALGGETDGGNDD